MFCDNIEQYAYDTSLHVVIQMIANKFFLVVMAVFFDSNCRGSDSDYFFMPQAFLFQRGCGSYGASTDETYSRPPRPPFQNFLING